MPGELLVTGPRRVEILEREAAPLPRGHVRVRSILSGVSSATELRHYLSGAPPGRFPVRTGYELVGRIVEVAPDAPAELAGRVAWLDRPHGEESVVTASIAQDGLVIDDSAPWERFAFLARTRTALNAVHDSSLRVGERVIVSGLGALGLLVARVAVLAGASQVLAVDPVQRRRELASRWGATSVAPRDLPAADPADVVFEASGDASALAAAVDRCAPYGRLVVVSTYPAGQLSMPGARSDKQLTILFSTTRPGVEPRQGPAWSRTRKLAAARELLLTGRVHAEELISDEFPFHAAGHAYRRLIEAPDQCLAAVLRYDRA